MTRFQFLKQLGLSSSAAFSLLCLNGCLYDHINTDDISHPIDFTLDLSLSDYSALKSPGGFVVFNDIVVAHSLASGFVAVTIVCSHQGYKEVTYDFSRDIFSCNEHGATFDLHGKGLNSRGAKGLKTYNTLLTGNSLRVFS